jgi:hypothetical protein
VSTALAGVPAVTVEELRRAWRAVQAGRFRGEAPIPERFGPPTGQARVWRPPPGEWVVPVVGCVGSCGASTLALAMATAADPPSRVVECSPATSSGLAAASTAELGLDCSGWTRGTRGEVLLERTSEVLLRVDELPVPSNPEPPVELTVLDVGWELGQLLATPSWLSDQVTHARTVVLVAPATIPGMRRLESALAALPDTPTVAAAVGPARRTWAGAAHCGAGPLIHALDDAGRLVTVRADRRLAVAGLDSTPLPARLVAAAARVLRLVGPGQDTAGGAA